MEWVQEILTTENQSSQRFLKGFLRVLSGLRGEIARQAQDMIHYSKLS